MNRLKLVLAGLCLLTSAAAVAQTPAPEAPTVLRVAVYDVETSSVDEKIGRLVTEGILAETRKLVGVEVIGMAEVRTMMNHEAQKQLAGCDQESCLAEIAEALGVDVLIIGSIATLNAESFMSVKRIDQLAVRRNLQPADDRGWRRRVSRRHRRCDRKNFSRYPTQG